MHNAEQMPSVLSSSETQCCIWLI